MKKRIVTYLIITQLAIISILVYEFLHKKNILFPNLAAFVNVFDKQEYTFPKVDSLKYFYEPTPGSKTEDLGFGIVNYNINSDTLNSTKNYNQIKPGGVYRIIALGDSFTFGLHVDTDKNWPSVLETKLNDNLHCKNIKSFEVINLGVAGYDTAYSLERFKLRGVKYHPDMILWLHTDLVRIMEKMTPFIISEGGVGSKDAWDDSEKLIIHKYGMDNILSFQKKYIEKLNKLSDASIGLIETFEMSNEGKKMLSEIVHEEKNEFIIDSIPNLESVNGKLKNDPHPNKEGDRIIAGKVYDYIVNNKKISCIQ